MALPKNIKIKKNKQVKSAKKGKKFRKNKTAKGGNRKKTKKNVKRNLSRNKKRRNHDRKKKVMKNQRRTKKKDHNRKKNNQRRKQSKANSERVKSQGKSSCMIDENCLMNVIDFVQTSKEKIKNYERQKKRIMTQNKTIHNKNSKKDNFQDILNHLNETIGVNGSGCMSPSSSFLNESATLLDSLSGCGEAIESACVIEVDLANDTGKDRKSN